MVETPLAWTRALVQPALCTQWSLPQWERVVRLSRRLRLLGRLAEAIDSAGLTAALPPDVVRCLAAERQFSRWRTGSLLWLLDRLAVIMAEAPYPLVLLKGAAYIAQDLPIARGRLPSDADILVPRPFVADARQRLLRTGWIETSLDEHDRRYYNEWSHEVPPLRHPSFGLELDLHHNILPPLSRTPVNADALLRDLQTCRWPRYRVLRPVDQVLHNAAHLFFDSEIRDRARDLVDFDGLVRAFSVNPGFWDELPERAVELGLTEPLALATHFCCAWMDTPIPPSARARIQLAGPGPARRAWLHPLLATLLTPTEPDAQPARTQSLAAPVFVARHHLWRLPLRLLIPHLWHKSLARRPAVPVPPGEAGVGTPDDPRP